MAKLKVLDWNKKEVGSVDVATGVVDGPVKKDVLHSVVNWQRACKRQGTHKAKRKGEVSGGGKKPFKQKGTGNARQGSSRSPINEGGGVIFGPLPRSYSYALPRKVRQIGLRSALSYLNSEGRLFVVKDMTSADGKTKELAARLKGFGATKTVLVDSEPNDLFKRASKNLAGVVYYPVGGLNVFDLLKYDCLVATEASIAKMVEKCGGAQ